MVAIKEVSPALNAQSPEAPQIEQNSFRRFIDENRSLFEEHSSLTYELRDEDHGRRNSPTIESLVKIGIEVVSILNPNINNLNNKQMRRLTEELKAITMGLIFGSSDEREGLIAKGVPNLISAQPHFTPQLEALGKTFDEGITEFRTSFREARSPLVSGIQESRAELFKKFEDFLLSHPSNMFVFGDFISDKKSNGTALEAIRPFLASFADAEQDLLKGKKEGILRRVVKQWTDELKEKPNPATIDEFTVSIKSPNILEWLEFAAQGEDIANFLKKSRPDVSFWTTELKEAFFSFVSSRYVTARSSIEKELGEFRRPLISKSILPPIDLELGKAKRAATTTAVKKEPDAGEKTLEKVEKGKYPIGILRKEIGSSSEVRVLTEDEWARHLQKEADSLAPDDQRMMADLEKMFSSLRKDPYGLGTEKFPVHTVVVENRRIPLRSFNSLKRIGLSHDHIDSYHIRIVYVIYKKNAEPIIGIEGIYRHDDYLRKFT